LKGGPPLRVSQDGFRTLIIGLPDKAPDAPVSTIVLECESAPMQDTDYVRINKPRAGVGI
jgi:alpha-L-fucosidase